MALINNKQLIVHQEETFDDESVRLLNELASQLYIAGIQQASGYTTVTTKTAGQYLTSTAGGATWLGNVAQWEPPVKVYCRVCGDEKQTGWRTHSLIFSQQDLCDDCVKKIIDTLIESLIPQNNALYCQECKSHYKACRCEKAQALKQLRQ